MSGTDRKKYSVAFFHIDILFTQYSIQQGLWTDGHTVSSNFENCEHNKLSVYEIIHLKI